MGPSDLLHAIGNFVRGALSLNPTNEERPGKSFLITPETLEKLVKAKEITEAQSDALKAHARK